MKVRTQEDMVINGVMVISLLVALAAVLYVLLVPPPTAQSVALQTERERQGYERNIRSAKFEIDASREKLEHSLWTEPLAEIGPRAISRVTTAAQAKGLKVNVRTQKVDDDGSLVTIPFVVTVEGAFPNVMALARQLDGGDMKLALTLFQVSSSDGASDKVTGTIGVAAFRMSDSAKVAKDGV